MTRCPSDLELERLLREPGSAGAAHLFSCPRCMARVAEARQLAAEFEREVFPATVEAVVAGAARPRRSRVVWLAPALAAGLALAFVGVRLLQPSEPGAPIDFLVYAGAPSALADGQHVSAGTGLRFEVRPHRSCNLFIASADAAGNVTRLFPPKEQTGKLGLKVEKGNTVAVQAPAPLAGQPGPRRLFALCGCGDEPIYWPDVVQAAQKSIHGEDELRNARTLPGLPDDTLQATLLVEREP
jgi:hypothetical protein